MSPGQATSAGSVAGEPILEGEIVTPPAPVTINITVTVNVHASPALKAELARIDAEALAVLARIDAAFAEQRDALYAWSGQLELTAGAA